MGFIIKFWNCKKTFFIFYVKVEETNKKVNVNPQKLYDCNRHEKNSKASPVMFLGNLKFLTRISAI